MGGGVVTPSSVMIGSCGIYKRIFLTAQPDSDAASRASLAVIR
jgi:hypothetical protein